MTVDKEMLESVHISISSLLRASTGIHQAIPLFLVRNVAFDRAPAANPSEVDQFWAMLDIEPGHLELFVNASGIGRSFMLALPCSLRLTLLVRFGLWC